MASRTMHYFRKHAGVIMVIMGIVCMITFVVGPSLIDLVTSRGSDHAAQNPVVVTWVNGKIHQDELYRMRLRHQVAYVFLRQVVAQAVERGGRPVINGRPVTDLQQIPDIIAQDSSDETLVRTLVLAEEARRLGVVVDQDAVKAFLRQLSSPELGEKDWLEIAHAVVSNRMTVNELNEQLALELKAQHVAALGRSGLFTHGMMPIVPPGEAWDMFNRLNRRLSIEAYPVDVEPLVAQVRGEPSAAEIEKLFDEGKFRDPDPTVDEPGFRKPQKLAFSWLKVNFAPFLEAAKTQITDAQIEEQYQKDIAQGLHKVQELPSATPPESKANADKSDADAEKKDEAHKDESKKEEPQKGEATKDSGKPASEPPPAKPGAAQPAESKPAGDKPADKSADKASDQPDCGATGDQDRADPPKTGDAAQEPPPAKPTETKAADEKPATENPPTEKPATDKPTTDKPTTDKPADEKAADAQAPAKEPKFKPLAEVRDDIHKRLAQPIADEARKKAVAEITSAIDKYGKAFRRYQDVTSVRKNADIKEPGKLDIVPLAARHNFEMGDTGLKDGKPIAVDRHEIAKFEIGQKVQQFDMEAARMGQLRYFSFADMAYSRDLPLFQAAEASSSEPDISYIYFRTGEEKAGDATLSEARPQVIAFWKRRQAFDLAKADAQKIAEKARTAPALAEVVADSSKVVTTPLFSWMTPGGFGFGRPELSQVAGIELAGQEFMEAVFALQPSETGVAPNQAHSRVYAVRVITQNPDDEQLRSRFLESGHNQLVLSLAQNQSLQTWFQWIEQLLAQYQVKWQRPSQDDQRV